MSKCYLTFDGEFKWTQDETEFVPLMSGGLLAMSRRWWRETGGYDREMAGWGGENIDQSLRIWRCGGEIVSATTSFVAHMWRDASEKRRAHYKIPPNAKATNVARAVQAHMGPWYGAKLLSFDPYVQFKADKLPGVGWGPSKLNTSEIRETLATCNRGFKAASGAKKIFNRTSTWVVSKRRSSHALRSPREMTARPNMSQTSRVEHGRESPDPFSPPRPRRSSGTSGASSTSTATPASCRPRPGSSATRPRASASASRIEHGATRRRREPRSRSSRANGNGRATPASGGSGRTATTMASAAAASGSGTRTSASSARAATTASGRPSATSRGPRPSARRSGRARASTSTGAASPSPPPACPSSAPAPGT